MSGEVLVTGAAGFIGRNAAQACLEAGYQVSAVDLRSCPPRLAGQVQWISGDYSQPELRSQIERGRYRAVLHQAAITDTRVRASAALTRTNTTLAVSLADACRRGGARFIYASSHAVYGALRQRAPIPESAVDDPSWCTGPLNPYGESKLALDRLMNDRHPTDLEWAGLRYTNVFGPDEQDKGPMACILSQLVEQAATRGEVRVFNDSLTAARDYLPVEVVAAVLVMLVEAAVPPAVYNLGSGHPVSFAEIVQWCAGWTAESDRGDLLVRLVPNPVAAAYQYYTCADTGALDAVLPGRPQVAKEDVRQRAEALFAACADRRDGQVNAGMASRARHLV